MGLVLYLTLYNHWFACLQLGGHSSVAIFSVYIFLGIHFKSLNGVILNIFLSFLLKTYLLSKNHSYSLPCDKPGFAYLYSWNFGLISLLYFTSLISNFTHVITSTHVEFVFFFRYSSPDKKTCIIYIFEISRIKFIPNNLKFMQVSKNFKLFTGSSSEFFYTNENYIV